MYICVYVCVCVCWFHICICMLSSCRLSDYFQNREAYCSSCSYHLGAKESCNVFCTQRSVSFHHNEPSVLTFCWAAAVLQVNPELQLDQCDTFWFDFKSHIKRLFFAIWTWTFLSFRFLSFGKGPGELVPPACPSPRESHVLLLRWTTSSWGGWGSDTWHGWFMALVWTW